MGWCKMYGNKNFGWFFRGRYDLISIQRFPNRRRWFLRKSFRPLMECCNVWFWKELCLIWFHQWHQPRKCIHSKVGQFFQRQLWGLSFRYKTNPVVPTALDLTTIYKFIPGLQITHTTNIISNKQVMHCSNNSNLLN